MIDTHAHLSKRFCESVEVDGVRVILAASNLEDSKENIELAQADKKQFWASVGIHPQCTDPQNRESIKDQLLLLEELVKANKVIVAIGECGLDFSTPPPNEKERSRNEQEALFRGQIEIAQEYKLPLIIHARKAVDEVVLILKDYKDIGGVFHCYAGGKKRIKNVLGLGESWYFGFDGNITYEVGLNEVVSEIPRDRLLAETDCPCLTPVPHRGEINKPEYVKFVYNKVAEIWQTNLEEAEKIIDNNARRLFKIKSL
ncbi:MAG: TatD family hydrolase [Candidatus Shapirobacteria bacterium]|jgi:TatD DNase family protein